MKPAFNTIKIDLTDNATLYSSKVGGDFISDNPPGAFLAQINLTEIPHFPYEHPHKRIYLPSKGWLQFFIGDDNEFGRDWPNRKGGVVRFAEELNGKVNESNYEYTPILKECGMLFEPVYERFDKVVGGSQLLGYPSFTQYDPREKKELQRYNTLLFQLDSEPGRVMWGDMGIGNFFISTEDLLNCDFSDVMFTWDCC